MPTPESSALNALAGEPPRIYLDHAATSWPKPEPVYQAVETWQRHSGAPHGRGAYREAIEVQRAVEQARAEIAGLLGAENSHQVIFTLNGTDSLNLAIHGVLAPGDHVVTSLAEHNSVLRPLRELEADGVIEVTRIDCDATGLIDAEAVASSLRSNTRLVALTHASNVTGAVQPMGEVSRRIAAHRGAGQGALFLVDAAQSMGHLPFTVEELGCDLLAAPGHKGLLGPLGTGVLYLRAGVEAQVKTLRQGGTGTRSDEDRQPETLPDKYEAGNLNVPGILGLGAGARWLREHGLAKVAEHEQTLTTRLIEGLSQIEGLRLYGPTGSQPRVGVVSVAVPGYDPQELAALLDAAQRIQVRAGIHCAPLIHRRLGSLAAGGTVRFSIGWNTTVEQIDTAIQAMQEVAQLAM